MLPCTIALFSSGVPVSRLLDAILGRSERTSEREKRPFASKIATPSFGPKVRAFGLVVVFETSTHVPTSCLLLIFAFGAPAALPAATASPTAVITDILIKLRRFIRFDGGARSSLPAGGRSATPDGRGTTCTARYGAPASAWRRMPTAHLVGADKCSGSRFR